MCVLLMTKFFQKFFGERLSFVASTPGVVNQEFNHHQPFPMGQPSFGTVLSALGKGTDELISIASERNSIARTMAKNPK